MSNFNIAITGANGYIGSYLVNYFKNLGHTVYEMARKKNPLTDNHFIYFELGKQNELDLKEIDILIHCAYDFSILDYATIQKINVQGSQLLFTQAKKQGVKKIIYLSSTSSFKEAVSHYGRAKYAIEDIAKEMNITIVRPGLVFNRNSGGIVRALESLVKKFPILPIIENGKQKFLPCHLDDLSALLLKIIQHPVDTSQPIIAASENYVTFKNMMQILAELHHKKIYMIPIPYILVFSMLKLAELLSLKTGLRSDSLKYMKYPNTKLNFDEKDSAGLIFRSFNLMTLKQ